MGNSKIIDDIKEQTIAKHKYFDHYFLKWVLKIGQAKSNSKPCYQNLIYVDPFSSSGEYSDGSFGSPIIALNKFINFANEHKTEQQKFYLFLNDIDKKRIEHLEAIIMKINIPDNIIIDIKCMLANDHIDYVLTEIEKISKKKSFFFIDPYKVAKNVISPDKIISILSDEYYSEVIFNHMVYDTVRNIKNHPEHYNAFYKLDASNISPQMHGDEFNSRFVDYVLMKNKEFNGNRLYTASYPFFTSRNGHLYYLVYFSKNDAGFDTVKESLWKVSDGLLEHKNTGNDLNQLSIFESNTNEITKGLRDYAISIKVDLLKTELLEQFTGKTVSVSKIVQFVKKETRFYTGQVKRKTLYPMEKEGLIICDRSSGYRKGTFPDEMEIQFN